MTYRLFYIDDDPNANIIVDGFNTTGLIHVTPIKPTSFEIQLEELRAYSSQYQGLILDLKLDEDLSSDRKAYYSATTLAQQIRTKVSEGEWNHEIPLILFTTQQKMNAAFSGDSASKELFDVLFTKDLITDKSLQIKVHSIIDAYCRIAKSKPDISKLLNIETINVLDKRIFPVSLLTAGTTSYNYSKIILNDLIGKPGPLIDELYLAARLGVDVAKSTDWVGLLDVIASETKYTGIFSSAWDRWWMHKLNEWWESNFGSAPLATLDARDRIEKLNGKFNFQLEVATPLPKASSYRYWTICQGYTSPLDPREGLRINESEPLPWQEARYISVEAALERVKRDIGLKVNPIEKDRFDNILKSFTNGSESKS